MIQKCISVFTSSACYSSPLLKKLDFFFPDRVSENTQISNFMKIRPVGAVLSHAVRRTKNASKERERERERDKGEY